ncbi:UNVERIFIED_CONTAM: hypothetical protein Sradi_6447200 [Sesamum radiatum]|uniref:Uncharacterized protein n=1 Tax=Sesamum radiatum TaxID=300843 RepID=A0AAW2K566_SESRA
MRAPAVLLPTCSRGSRAPKGTYRWPSPRVGRAMLAVLKYNSHRAADRILCRRLKYVTGYCKRQSGFAATIR